MIVFLSSLVILTSENGGESEINLATSCSMVNTKTLRGQENCAQRHFQLFTATSKRYSRKK